MINLQNVHLTNEEIIIDDRLKFSAIGKTAVLENCIVRCMVPAKCIAIHGTLRNSTIIAERKLTGFSWLESTLLNCKFLGTFKDNHFGTMSNSAGACEACVFTDADLDDCQFFGTLDETHRFRPWPTVVVENPHLNVLQLKERAKTESLSIFADSFDFLHKEACATVCDARKLCKELRVDIEELKTFLSHFDFVKT